MATTSAPLYLIEEDLMALLDTEALVSPEQQEEFRQELAQQLKTAVEKRERVGHFILLCEHQQENCDAEIKRLQTLKQQYAKAKIRCEEYVIYTIESLGTDAKHKYQKLRGETVELSVARNPESLDVVDEDLVPDQYKDATVVLPVSSWKWLLEQTPDLCKAKSVTFSIRRSELKKAIQAGAEVDGADVKTGELRCVVK